MIVEKNLGSRVFHIVNTLILGIVVLTFVLPFLYMFSVSISDPTAVAKYEIGLYPKGINWEAYKKLLGNSEVFICYYNSIRYTLVGTIISVIIACLTAFPLSLSKLKYRRPISLFFTFTMFFSGGLIPTFLLYKDINIIDTMWAIVLPCAFSFWNIVLVKSNFQSLPQELYESAYIDGANDWIILFKIVIPLSKAIIATITLFVAVGIWNNYFGPLMYLTSPDMQPLTVLLRRILIANEVFNETDVRTDIVDPIIYSGQTISLRMATIFVTIGPIIFIYPMIQKYFVKGIMIGSIKG